ncbi:MAG: molybdenum cofactor biosynthesis protein B [Candidatus Thorarchaeota archaeon]
MIDEHRRDQKISTGIAVLIVSDSRTKDTDKSGKIAIELLEAEDHKVLAYDIVKNDAQEIEDAIKVYLDNPEIRVILTSGGTGVSSKDLTVTTVSKMFDEVLPGFGEHFRRISHEEIGVAGIFSRSTAGLIGKKVTFCLPGSKNAVKTALTKIILPGIGHLLWEVDR